MNKPQLKSFKSIAVIQTAFIGDVALTLPLAAKIKQINPECKLSFITTPQAYEIPKLLSDIDNVIILDKRNSHKGITGLNNFKKECDACNFDCIISPHRSFRTTILVKMLHPKFSVSFNTSTLSLLYSKRVLYKIHLHEKARNLSLLSVFSDFDNQYDLNPELNLNFQSSDVNLVNKILSENNLSDNEFIIIAPGSVWETKKWGKENYSNLIHQIVSNNTKCVLIGSQSDFELCQDIKSNTESLNLAGVTSIPQTILLLKKSKLVITNDSGPIHFAGLAKCPVIALFGPTTPKFGFAPTGLNDKIIENNNLKCRPCAIHGSKKCPINTHECMTSIKPEIVFNTIQSIIR